MQTSVKSKELSPIRTMMKPRISMLLMIALALGITRAVIAESNVTGKQETKQSVQRQQARGDTDLSMPVLDFKKKGDFFRYTLTNHTEWVFTNHKAGRQIWLQVSQDSTGGWTNTW